MTAHANNIKKISIPTNQPFTDTLAEQILSTHKTLLPDLSPINIILPNAQAVQQMRLSLTNKSQQAFIGGFIGNLSQWLNKNIAGETQKKTISQAARQLLLIDALKQHSNLFKTENHWQVCDSLLELFNELNLSPHQWLNEKTPVWIEQLQKAYQTNENINHLNQEAEIIQTLWNAWQMQLDALQINDEASALKYKLQCPVPEQFHNSHFYIVGLNQFSPLEQAWCNELSKTVNLTSVIQGDLPDSNQSTSTNNELILLREIYSQKKTFQQRTKQYTNNNEPSFLDSIKLFDAQSAEQEAQAADLKVRMSLLAGNSNIAVVTENRKIARRLRALLDRANVSIQDTAGWALATTSAATILERWLECIEQNFAYQPLLDLLKSPFFHRPENRDEHLNQVYRFEQDVILHENIANDLTRFKKAIQIRSERLDLNTTSTSENLLSLLDKIETAAKPLLNLYESNEVTTPDIWINCFISSIKQLDIYPQLANDMAGIRVQEELEKLSFSHNIATPRMDWLDFRTWLGNTFETEQFKPHSQTNSVKIMNMQQAQYCQFETLIIAGANIQSLPGNPGQMAFFNQSVREKLLLKNWRQQKQDSFYQFQQLLLAADDILITWQAEKNGEWMQASPWVSSLEDFSLHAYNKSLHDKKLACLLDNINSVTNHDDIILNKIKTVTAAAPVIDNKLIPREFSASRHQRLLECPYKFFASDALKLKAVEKISTELMKSEYGEKVHLILQAFHQQCRDLPAPFKEPLTNNNKDKALKHIFDLSKQVFKSQIEDSIQHRGWLDRWLDTAEAYINWQIKRQEEWNIYQLEEQAEYKLNSDITLSGRLDRIDKQGDHYSIIDYKTGNPAKQIDIDIAENIQLTSYAALMNEVSNVIYLKLDKGEVKQAGILEDEDLSNLKTDVLQRLETIISEIRSSHPLHSWGDSAACAYCDMSGLCRKQMWEVTN